MRKRVLPAALFLLMLFPTLGLAESSFGVCEFSQNSAGSYNRVEWDFDPAKGLNRAKFNSFFQGENTVEWSGKIVNITNKENNYNINIRLYSPSSEVEMELLISEQKNPRMFFLYQVFFIYHNGEKLVRAASGHGTGLNCVLRYQ